MKYFISLNGIRGAAVLLVMLFHFGWLPLGWIGVQIFFVLSGYLITTILLEYRISSVVIGLTQFYWRRALRILPVLGILFIALGALYVAIGVPQSYEKDLPWLVGFAANFARMRPDDLDTEYVHLWSLAVEEQFYLLWPFVMLLLPISSIKKAIIGMLLLCPILRLVVFQFLVSHSFDAQFAGKAIYVLPFTQFDSFATGAAISLWPAVFQENSTTRTVCAALLVGTAGLCVLVWSHFSGAGAFLFSFGYAMYLVECYGFVWGYCLLNVFFAFFIAGAVSGSSWIAWIESKWLTSFGRISYGVYVYHLPLLVLCNSQIEHFGGRDSPTASLSLFVVWVAIVVGVSILSYRWIESPILAFKDRVVPHSRRV